MHEREFTFSAILMVANRLQTEFDGCFGDLTLKQWLCLAVVSSSTEPTVATVAATIGTSHQNTAKLVRALESKGFVELEASGVDKRARIIRATPKALAANKRHEQAASEALTRLYAGLNDAEIATTLRVLDTMSRNLTGQSVLPKEH